MDATQTYATLIRPVLSWRVEARLPLKHNIAVRPGRMEEATSLAKNTVGFESEYPEIICKQ